MNACLLVVCFSLSSIGSQDHWLAEDKFKHFFASFVVTSLAASGVRAAGLDSGTSLTVGAAVGAGVGIWKEIRDDRIPGRSASARDLVWDFAGVGAAVAVGAQSR